MSKTRKQVGSQTNVPRIGEPQTPSRSASPPSIEPPTKQYSVRVPKPLRSMPSPGPVLSEGKLSQASKPSTKEKNMAMKQEPKKDRAKAWPSDSKGASEREERPLVSPLSPEDERLIEALANQRPPTPKILPGRAPIRGRRQDSVNPTVVDAQLRPPVLYVSPEEGLEVQDEQPSSEYGAKAQAAAEAEVEALVANAQAAAEAKVQPKMEMGLISFLGGVINGAVTAIDESLELIIDPVKRLVGGSLKGLVPALLGAALSPFLWPLAAGLLTLGVAQALCLQEGTLEKLVQPLQEQPASEDTLRKVIEDVLSQDRQANEDLAQFFKRIAPLIQKAEATTNVHISGPVHGLIVGDQNTVTQKFESSFLTRS